MNLTYDSQMFRETFESEFTWLNGFMRNVRRHFLRSKLGYLGFLEETV